MGLDSRISVYVRALFLLFLALLAFVIYQLSMNPEVGFLKPSFRGDWILAPYSSFDTSLGQYPSAVFKEEIHLPQDVQLIESAPIEITAARSFKIYVNGRRVFSREESDLGERWKHSKKYDLKEFLTAGHNTIEIEVYHTQRPPALLVNGEIVFKAQNPLRFDSDRSWQVSIDERKSWNTPEPTITPRDYYPSHLRLYSLTSFRLMKLIAGTLVLIILTSAFRVYFRRIAPEHGACAPVGDKGFESCFLTKFTRRPRPMIYLSGGIFFAICTLLAVMRDPYTGWDAAGHIDHIRHVASSWRLPSPDDGPQMYQPPAYYFLTALFYRTALAIPEYPSTSHIPSDLFALKVVQLLTPVFACFQVIITLKTVSRFFCEHSFFLVPTAIFVLFLPMQVYVSQFISNEVFASAAISLALYRLIILVSNSDYSLKHTVLLGAALGLAFLSKYSGLLIVLTTGFVYMVIIVGEKTSRKRVVRSFFICMTVFLLIAGPFYLNNYRQEGKIFYAGKGLQLEYRNLGFLLDPSNIGVGAVDKFVSRTVSFIDGNYSSMWLDQSHRIHSWTRVFDFVIYYLAIFPTFLLAVGFARAIILCNRDAHQARRCLPVLVLIMLAVFSYIYFVFLNYSFEIVKAFYMLSQMTGLAVFFVLGLKAAAERPRRFRVFLWACSVLWATVISYYVLAGLLIGESL